MTLGDNVETGTRAVLMKLQRGTAAVENSLVGLKMLIMGQKWALIPVTSTIYRNPVSKQNVAMELLYEESIYV